MEILVCAMGNFTRVLKPPKSGIPFFEIDTQAEICFTLSIRRYPVKTILVLLILFSAIALPALGELTDADLDKIRLIVKDEVTKELTKELAPIKADIASIKADIGTLKEDVARLDGRLTGVEKQVSHATNVTYGAQSP